MTARCRACRRRLRDEVSRARGYGPVCARAAGLAPERHPRIRRPDRFDPADGQLALDDGQLDLDPDVSPRKEI